jgi:flavin reductase (DIM6/NTAB) family NADH-FMN oxidoreductase RutF
MIIKAKETDRQQMYKILIGSVLPRPIAWVSTTSKEGINNLAPFSFFTVASANPPVLCFTPAFKSEIVDGKEEIVPKDTLRNIRDTGEFVVNIVSRFLAEKMNQTSADYPHNVSEFEKAGVTAAPSLMVRPPRVEESLINFECKLFELVEIAKLPGAGTLILGEVQCMHFADHVYKDGHIDLDILQPIGRLSGHFYTGVNERFEIMRPVLATTPTL